MSDTAEVHSVAPGVLTGQGPVPIQRTEPKPKMEPVIARAEEIDWDAEPMLIDPDEANSAVQTTFWFPLTQTSINMGKFPPNRAHVKLVSLADRTLVNTLPHEVRQVVDRIYNTNIPQNLQDAERTERILQRAQETASAYCVAGFINPPVVWRREDAPRGSGKLWVGAIALHDRQEFMRICESEDVLAARRLRPFLDESAGAL